MLSQYNELESKLANQLYNEFGVSESQARNIIASETQRNTQTACRRFFCSGRREMKLMRDNEKIADRFSGRLF